MTDCAYGPHRKEGVTALLADVTGTNGIFQKFERWFDKIIEGFNNYIFFFFVY